MSVVENKLHFLAALRQLSGKRVVVIGVGRAGQNAALLALKLGAKVQLLDDRVAREVHGSCHALLKGLPIESRWDSFEFLEDDVVVLSPGVPRRREGVQKAIASGALLVNELELAAAQIEPKVILGITGTNGKSTTTALLGNILCAAFNDGGRGYKEQRVFVGGNLGPTLCEAVYQGMRPEYLVLELSSYQLETVSLLRFTAVALTNLAPDHLNRYDFVSDYYAVKLSLQNLCDGRSFANGRDQNSVDLLAGNDDWSLLCDEGEAQITGGEGWGEIFLGDRITGVKDVTLSFKNNVLVGEHNLENALFAAVLAREAGVSDDALCRGIASFTGISHRLERLGVVNGVQYYNDSKATNVEAAATAVRSFAGGIRLLVGGVGKGASYAPLLLAAEGKVCSVHCIGEEGEALKKVFEAAGFLAFRDENLTSAFSHASKLAVCGEVVLLAPACASFDQFKNFEVRGNAFRVLFLEKERGGIT